ncbi:hypothetical protein [Bordetella ansorpii]|nr:hypothetical protein [Bordetella ansorpii]
MLEPHLEQKRIHKASGVLHPAPVNRKMAPGRFSRHAFAARRPGVKK